MHTFNSNEYGYGLWITVVFNVLIFSLFTYSVFKPVTKRDWKTLGVFSAFLVALFTEMYGFPLTIYLLTSILGNKYPVLNPFAHSNGHLIAVFLGGGEGTLAAIHLISNGLIIAGLVVIAVGWKRIHRGSGDLVTDGIYRYVRHPQYTGFFMNILGFLIQWPSISAIVMAPVLTVIYYRLAKQEENIMIEQFGERYIEYMREVPMFIPRITGRVQSSEMRSK
jgi:protein-S-isoprenylcysteine O-methyltransferase Ste14